MEWDLLRNFRDPDLTRKLLAVLDSRLEQAANKVGRVPVVMEVCGTHTMAFSKTGLRHVIKDKTHLLSGPGCPVCVTSQEDIDTMLALAGRPGMILATFGDLMRVPGTHTTLLKEKAAGADIRVVYSPLDALATAAENPDKEIVFLGIGFETTVPIVAMSLKEALRRQLKNFSIFSVHKAAAPVMAVLVQDQTLQLDGFILPGHVSVVIGEKGFAFLKKTKIPSVITGFDPVDLIQGLILLTDMLLNNDTGVANQYTRLVRPEGNPVAQEMIRTYFTPSGANWRGIGEIPESGFLLKQEYEMFDARLRFPVSLPPVGYKKACLCGEIIKGKATPLQCPLFEKTCNPLHPLGPCMVSVEGTCSAYYQYEKGNCRYA